MSITIPSSPASFGPIYWPTEGGLGQQPPPPSQPVTFDLTPYAGLSLVSGYWITVADWRFYPGAQKPQEPVAETGNCSGGVCAHSQPLPPAVTASLTGVTHTAMLTNAQLADISAALGSVMNAVWYLQSQGGAGHVNITSFTLTLVFCAETISPLSASYGPAGGSGSITVSAVGSSCLWTAISNDSWIVVVSGRSGQGNGSVSYLVDANAGANRTGTITAAQQTFTITQSSCGYSIYPAS
ncbi:MAG TPA: BACON domain-containing protein, partial [Chthonomonadales bacterium]|nr:BACON domain-containing protein [Chthonomonadales bacterium]